MKKIYKHYKGTLYAVVGVAVHTETNQLLTIYHNFDVGNMKNPPLFARPSGMFYGKMADGTQRFTEVKDK